MGGVRSRCPARTLAGAMIAAALLAGASRVHAGDSDGRSGDASRAQEPDGNEGGKSERRSGTPDGDEDGLPPVPPPPSPPSSPDREAPSDEEPPRGGTPKPTPDLMPRLPLARAVGWILPNGPRPSSPTGRAKRHAQGYLDRRQARDRLKHVGADGWYYDAQRVMRRAFEPDMRKAEKERRASMSPLEAVVDELSRYGSGPEPPGRVPGQPPIEHASQYSDAQKRLLRSQEQMNLNSAPTTWYRTVVRVTHSPEGQVQAVWVVRSSGSETLDEAALEAVRESAEQLPRPPARVVGARDAIRSDWAFEAGDVASYLGAGGCVTGGPRGPQCAAGGRGIVRTRIQLLRVRDATEASSRPPPIPAP